MHAEHDALDLRDALALPTPLQRTHENVQIAAAEVVGRAAANVLDRRVHRVGSSMGMGMLA